MIVSLVILVEFKVEPTFVHAFRFKFLIMI